MPHNAIHRIVIRKLIVYFSFLIDFANDVANKVSDSNTVNKYSEKMFENAVSDFAGNGVMTFQGTVTKSILLLLLVIVTGIKTNFEKSEYSPSPFREISISPVIFLQTSIGGGTTVKNVR